LAAARLPALLVPYPSAADDHQVANAEAFERAGAASWQDQAGLDGSAVGKWVVEMLADNARRESMRRALVRRNRPDAAMDIAKAILSGLADDLGQQGAARGTGEREVMPKRVDVTEDVRYSGGLVEEGSGGGRL
jgi:hypothetical protein